MWLINHNDIVTAWGHMIISTLRDVIMIDRNNRETMFGHMIIYTPRDAIIIHSGIDSTTDSLKTGVNHNWHLLIQWNQSTYAMWVNESIKHSSMESTFYAWINSSITSAQHMRAKRESANNGWNCQQCKCIKLILCNLM